MNVNLDDYINDEDRYGDWNYSCYGCNNNLLVILHTCNTTIQDRRERLNKSLKEVTK